MCPGKVVYVSNKNGGKKGVYTTNYDGSDEKALGSPRVADTQDYDASVSVHDRYVSFISTRDSRKITMDPLTQHCTYQNRWHGLIKISDFYGITQVQWSPVGTYLAWIGRENDSDTFSKVAIRDIDAGQQCTMETGDSISSYSFAKMIPLLYLVYRIIRRLRHAKVSMSQKATEKY